MDRFDLKIDLESQHRAKVCSRHAEKRDDATPPGFPCRVASKDSPLSGKPKRLVGICRRRGGIAPGLSGVMGRPDASREMASGGVERRPWNLLDEQVRKIEIVDPCPALEGWVDDPEQFLA